MTLNYMSYNIVNGLILLALSLSQTPKTLNSHYHNLHHILGACELQCVMGRNLVLSFRVIPNVLDRHCSHVHMYIHAL